MYLIIEEFAIIVNQIPFEKTNKITNDIVHLESVSNRLSTSIGEQNH